MKTAPIPSIQLEPSLLAEVEAVLAESETLSEFVEASVRATVERRRMRAEFAARGVGSHDEARHTGEPIGADVVLESLQRKFDALHAQLTKLRK